MAHCLMMHVNVVSDRKDTKTKGKMYAVLSTL